MGYLRTGKHTIYNQSITKTYYKGIDAIGMRIPIVQKQKYQCNGHTRASNTHPIVSAARPLSLRQIQIVMSVDIWTKKLLTPVICIFLITYMYLSLSQMSYLLGSAYVNYLSFLTLLSQCFINFSMPFMALTLMHQNHSSKGKTRYISCLEGFLPPYHTYSCFWLMKTSYSKIVQFFIFFIINCWLHSTYYRACCDLELFNIQLRITIFKV